MIKRPFGRSSALPQQQDITEAQIKRQICDWLKAMNCFFWIQQAGKIPGRMNKSVYLRNGISDILGLWKSRMLAIEVKKPKGVVSDEQQEFLEMVNRYGGIGFVAYSLSDVINHLLGQKHE
jgi:hypothetical protein